MSDLDWLTKVPVECVKCGQEVVTDFDSIEERASLKCSNCDAEFHIFDVYDMYYNQEPLVKNCFDLVLKYSKQPYKIESEDKIANDVIERFLVDMDFDKLSERIFHDLAIYGDAYILIKRSQNGKDITQLEPLEPKTMKIILGGEVRHGRGWTGEREVTGFVKETDSGIENLSPNDVVHMKRRDFSPYEPYGVSIMRIALRYIHYLRASRGSTRAGAEEWLNYLRNGICLGMGVPLILLADNLTNLNRIALEMASTHFTGTIHQLHWSTAPLERHLFAEITNKKFREIPRLEWKKLESTKILKDRGFFFLEEIKALKKLMDLGIITQKEYQDAVSKYLPES